MSFIIEPFRETIPISRDSCVLRIGQLRKRVESRADMKTEMNISSFLCLVRNTKHLLKAGRD